jgi:nitrogen fixation/metabolism regulation signal transduction histidine kinase
MASRIASLSAFALGVCVRAALIGGLLWGVVELVVRLHYYASALVLLGIAILIALDIARCASAADRMLTAFAQGLAAGAVERPARAPPAFDELTTAIRRAADAIDAERDARQRRIDALEAMLDTVNACLFVLGADDMILHANRAAQALAREPAARLSDIAAIGNEIGTQLGSLGPGVREIVRLEDGRRMLAASAAFVSPGGERRRLISLQSLSGDLDVVELRAWQDLSRVLAHEMMNSLTPIVSLAESLAELLQDETSAPGSDAVAAVQVIARRSQGLMGFVDRYRRVAELPPPEYANVRLADLSSGLERLMAPIFRERGIDYYSEVTPPELIVHADGELLEQAVLNLLKNAVEAATDAGTPEIRLLCRTRPDGLVEISVLDNGRGLPDDPESLFVPFFTTKGEGSGIGLSIARQVALAHHGRAVAERREPCGAVFSLLIPSGAPESPAET